MTWLLAAVVGALGVMSVPARAQAVEDLGAPVEKGSAITYGKLVASIFKGARTGKDPGTLVTTSEKILRRLGTKERTVLPPGTSLTSFEVVRVRGDGRRYLVLLCGTETPDTDVPGGGAAVLAIFPEGSAEPQDVADVKEDVFCSFGEKFMPSLGPDDGFTVINHHSNSNQSYDATALYHVHQGRLKCIDSVFTLWVRGLCEKSFQEALVWRTEPDPAGPYPKIVATVTVTFSPDEEEVADCPKRKGKVPTQAYSETYRWDKAQGRYESGGKGFQALDRFNQANM